MDKKAFQNIQKKLNLTNEGVSGALDVELFTVQMWACGTWSIPRPIIKFLYTLLSVKKDNEAIYMSGYGRGRNAGLKEGRLTQVEGYTVGYHDGYKEGKTHGRVEGLAVGPADSKKNSDAEYTRMVDGYTTGYDDGHRVGFGAGRVEGLTVGYDEGYMAAMEAVGLGQ